MECLERSRWGQLVLSLVVVLAGCVEDAGPEREGVGNRSDRVGTRSTVAAELAVERPRVGCVIALSGQLRPTGEAIVAGLRAGLAGGFEPGSEPFELLVVDDGYDPRRTVAAVSDLGGDPGVLGLIGCLGTPTAIAGLPIAAECGLLWYGGFSGAEVLRDAERRGEAVNVRASYQDEIRAIVRGLLGEVGLSGEEVAFFTQRDGFGDDGFRAGLDELQALSGIEPGSVVHARYDRELGVISVGLASLMAEPIPPRAVLVVGHARALVDLVRRAEREGFRPLWCGASFVDAFQVVSELGALAEGHVFTMVIEEGESATPERAAFRSVVEPRWRGSQLAFEAYLIATALRHDAEARGVPASRREFASRALELAAAIRRDGRGGLGRVWPMIVRGGVLEPLRWADLRGSGR